MVPDLTTTLTPAATVIVTIRTLTSPRILHPRPLPFTWHTNGQTVMLSHHTRLMD